MKKTVLVAMATPVAAAVVVGAVLVATRHTALPRLTPVARPHGPSPSSSPPAGRCAKPAVATPFAGIAVNPQITPHVTSFERATGAHVGVVEFYDAFNGPFQRWEARQATALRALPLIQLNPRNVALADIAAGKYDTPIKRYADAVKAYRCQVALSFGHEMNGWWYTWGRPWTSPGTFIAAWRHIHDVFAAQHVTNVIWSWDPTHQYQGKTASFASQWYPGDAYVDWIGIDGYLGAGQTFADVFARQLADIRRVTSKPVFIGETGVAGGPRQGWQIAGLFAGVRKYHLIGLVWFDLDRKQPWRLEGRQAALAGYRKGLASLG